MSLEILRINADFADHADLLALIRRAFAYMDEVIDPPSSAHALTVDSLAKKARDEIGLIARENGILLACAFLRPEPEFLYLGKLAVDPDAQGRGLGLSLLHEAEAIAQALSLPALRLETRIELTDNHKRFSAWGFTKTAENRHPGFDRTTSIEMQKRLR